MSVRLLASAELHDHVDGIAAMMGDCIDEGASVGWILPYELTDLERFWRGIAERCAAG